MAAAQRRKLDFPWRRGAPWVLSWGPRRGAAGGRTLRASGGTSDWTGGNCAFLSVFCVPGAVLAAGALLLSHVIKLTHYPDPPFCIWGN